MRAYPLCVTNPEDFDPDEKPRWVRWAAYLSVALALVGLCVAVGFLVQGYFPE